MSNPNLGMGAFGFGTAAFGFGVPAATDISTSPVLLQADGTPGNCALIDARTSDYVLDARGNKVGWDSTSQAVYLALRTKLGSSAVSTLGIDLPSGVITATMEARIRQAVAAALKTLTDAKRVVLVAVLVSRPGVSAYLVEVQWRNTTTGLVQSTFI